MHVLGLDSIVDRNTIAEHLIRKYDGDMDEIQEYIRLNIFTWTGVRI